ncbi:chaperone DnaK-related protein [Psychromonas ingrahamii 37]|uniref:Chaperone DnaK-related protein n=1 Tax=Psychromonas ingrahamii (strain DSM 17664 / CCUG 51855 / 37) TaxID=357804 RepID=A1SU98_PSYIN|nr:Hsp70 family protein [Psychromonas ingrahamii]ABM03063.1 chaperone DnaK-related protein [Psychromonas ingrahamii 37]
MNNLVVKYLIGIDLGTTNTVVAYTDMLKPLTSDNCHIFEIEQLVAPGEVAKRPLLPSFRYHPAGGEINPIDLQLPWSDVAVDKLEGELPLVVIGEWARELGAKVDGRQVVSAKSWLSHPHVDRNADILPWAGAEGVAKVSPVLASASYLLHVRHAWNFAHPDALMEDQEVVITIPASFDEGARALTVEAASRAGLVNILLLEEPQAVCYDWYARQGARVQRELAKIKLLMVCDVGGGTTDLSLIKVAQGKDNSLALTRIGVGNHLMLGGDNVDLALAHIAEGLINGGTSANKKLSAANLSQLIQQTRKAKELLMGDDAPGSARVTVLGSGAKLIGGAKSCELTKQAVRDIALDGFFPNISFDQRPLKRRSAVVEFGLPYAADPAVSKHVAEFIADHQIACKDALGIDSTQSGHAIPDAVLFNGGVFNSAVLSERTIELLSEWRGSAVNRLENHHPNLAVAQGAVAYARARRGAQLKIGGGSARTVFLVLEQQDAGKQAICLMPKGTEEEQELTLSERKFSLQLGLPVQFHLFSTTADQGYKIGEIITLDEQTLASGRFISLPPLVVVLEKTTLDSVIVSLATRFTEVGTLKIDCVAENQQRWHLEFQIRQPLSQRTATDKTDALPDCFDQVREKVDLVFGESKKQITPKAVKSLRADIEKLLGKREHWELPLLRALFDQLLEGKNHRRRSAAHERIWFNLAGYCLRPGFGYLIDDWRVEQIWGLYEQGLQHHQETQVWIDWWTFWRRASGGLSALQQARVFEDIEKFINPAALTNRKLKEEAKQKSYQDMVKLVATLELLPIEHKTKISEWLLKRLQKSSETSSSWWALGRLASRIPFHGSAHNVIDKKEIQSWLPQLLSIDWKKNPQAAFAVVLMSRMSGDRSRDLDADWRAKIIQQLTLVKAAESWIEMVDSIKELNEAETKRVFGEGLPIGLKLIQ